MTTTSLQTGAATADTVIKDIMKFEPTVASAVGMFVPGAAPIIAAVQPVVLMAVPFIEKAIEDLAAGNNGDVFASVIQLIQHISAGQPNSPILSPPAPTPDMPPPASA